MVKLFVEGGGDNRPLRDECRRGFNTFLIKVGLEGRMPRIVACGSRRQAYDDFCTAIANGVDAYLLVDSEEPVGPTNQIGEPETWLPWTHLQRDSWEKPSDARDLSCHLMVQSMETWLIADKAAIVAYYGDGFNSNPLPATITESLTKQQVITALENAIRNCTTKGKNNYSKGQHSFKILEQIDPNKVTAASRWAKRFVDTLIRELE